jgi:cytochrome c-type biogenesis protein CcmH/NrfF
MIPTITLEMIADTEQEIANRREVTPVIHGLAFKDIKNMRCTVCGENAVSFVDDLMIRVGDTDVPNLTGLRCAVCGDHSFDADASKIISDMRQMQRLEKTPPIRGLSDAYRDSLNKDRGYGERDV